ncbi:MAG: type I secretion protein, partial [Paracoccaceae bacterium]
MDPFLGLPVGTAMSVVDYDMVDQNDNGDIEPGAGDTVNGLTVTQVWVNDTITVDMGGGPVTITGVTFYVSGGPPVFTPTDGTILSNATFVSSTYVTVSTQIPIADLAPPCF